MGTSRLFVDLLSLRAFHRTLEARLDEAQAALAMLEQPPNGPLRLITMAEPALGTFDDAIRTSLKHHRLRLEYAERLRRLIGALQGARSVTEDMIQKFASAEKVNVAQMREIVHRIAEELEHGPADGR